MRILGAMTRATRVLLSSMLAISLAGLGATTAVAAPHHENCTKFNQKYPHGVGKKGAKDKTSGTPVTTFKKSTKLYNAAMKANSRLDGDKDGIACERA